MSDKVDNYEIIFAVYDAEDGAAGAVASLKRMDDANAIDIIDAATLVKDAEGAVSVKQESLPSVKKGVGIGALVGGAIGLLFPPSILATAALGAGLGAGSAKLAKMALENDELKEAAEKLEPGTSAFIAVVDNTWVKQLQEAISGYHDLAAHTLDAEASGVVGMLAAEGEVTMYGSTASDSEVSAFEISTDGESVVARATTALADDDGNVAVQRVDAAFAADEDGNVAGVVSNVAAVADADGNVVAEAQVGVGYLQPGEDAPEALEAPVEGDSEES